MAVVRFLPRLGPVRPGDLRYFQATLLATPKELRRAFAKFEDLGPHFAELRYWRILPYGLWRTHSGDRVIFDREYCPLVRITPARTREPDSVSRSPRESSRCTGGDFG